MKTMMIFLLLIFSFSNLKAQEEPQEENQLDEAKVTYKHTIKVKLDLEDITFDVKEDYKGQFHENPVKFCDENFDIQALIESIDSDEFTEYEITFNNRKGYITATYDRDGELLKTFQRFKDINLPNRVVQKLFRDNKGWTMVKNKYVAIGEGNKIHKEKYRIGMRKGNATRNVKIVPQEIPGGRLAGN